MNATPTGQHPQLGGLNGITFWGLTASPYQLKMQALADAAGTPWQRLPDQGTLRTVLRVGWRLRRAQQTHSVERFRELEADLDEYPAVPYYTFDGRRFFYDSSDLAYHLAAVVPRAKALLPADPAMSFICQLIDEAFDEFGLYLVHHNRWITSAATNRMGDISSNELVKWLPGGIRRRVSRALSERQVRRCPYLFSVAPQGFQAGVSAERTPPSRPGFPATHQLLDRAWRRYLAALESLLAYQPYLLGGHFTLADASAYGQLSMNLVDGKAAQLLQTIAPRTFAWLCMIRDGGHTGAAGELYLSENLAPLLRIIGATFLPLMQQNSAAYRAAKAAGQTVFNEAAFDRGEALYDGTLLGQPFRSVAKSFQVRVWRDLCTRWQTLERAQREQLHTLCPLLADAQFTGDGN